MTYSAADARQQILDRTAEATEHLGVAVASLAAAYEMLDEAMADRLENELFRPVQLAFGRAQRAHAGFAARTNMAAHEFAQPAPSHRDARAQIDRAVAEVRAADDGLADLQDSMLAVEVGDINYVRRSQKSATASDTWLATRTSSRASLAASTHPGPAPHRATSRHSIHVDRDPTQAFSALRAGCTRQAGA